MLTALTNALKGKFRPAGVAGRSTTAPTWEPLEDRLLLSLLGVGNEIVSPQIVHDSVGQVAYQAAADAFDVDSVPMAILFPDGGFALVDEPRDVQLHIRVDDSGGLLGGVEGDDFVVVGKIDRNPLDGVVDYDGVLLTGEVVAFGYLDGGPSDTFDLRLTPTGGLLMSFFEGKDIGLVINSSTLIDHPELSFDGHFQADFLQHSHGLLGVIERTSMLSGLAYVDANNDGQIDAHELAIEGVNVQLSGTDYLGNEVDLTDVTDSDGVYSFVDLRPGAYTITEIQPSGYEDGIDTLGSTGGTLGNDVFSDIQVAGGVDGINYNFGEHGGTVTGGQSATIGFWQNKKGQELLRSVDAGLGAWLAETFPNMYGADAGDRNLTGMSNEQVGVFYRDLFKAKARRKGQPGPAKLDCQVMAVAFAAYVTSSNLAGGAAAQYGFLVTEHGVGIASFNVGSCGAAFGVEDNTEVSILTLLLATNEQTVQGELYYELDTLLRSMANEVYTAVNEAGHI